MTDLPPEFSALVALVDAQPAPVREAFRYCLALGMAAAGKNQLSSSFSRRERDDMRVRVVGGRAVHLGEAGDDKGTRSHGEDDVESDFGGRELAVTPASPSRVLGRAAAAAPASGSAWPSRR
jgi:hypothetical protein